MVRKVTVHGITHIVGMGVGRIVHRRITPDVVTAGLYRPVRVLQHATHAGNILFLQKGNNLLLPVFSLKIGIIIEEHE